MAIGDSSRQGYNTIIGVGRESTWGVTASSFYYVEFLSESLSHIVEEILIESINSTRDYIRRLTGNESVEGGLETHFDPASGATVRLMQGAIGGTISSSSLTTGSYRHIMSVGDTDSSGAKGLTLNVINAAKTTTARNMMFTGCKVNSWTLKGEIGSPVVMTNEFIGKTAEKDNGSLPAASFPNSPPVNFSGITIKVGGSSSSVTEECFTGFELTINNNLVSDSNVRCLGSRTLATLPATRREVKLKLTQRFDTTTSYDRFIENTMCAVSILLDTGYSIGSSGGSTVSIAITLPSVYYNSNNFQVSDFGVLTNELDLTAIKEPSTGAEIIRFSIVNATSAY